MKRHSTSRAGWILISCLLLWGTPLYAVEYMPLEMGNFWNYETEEGLTETLEITEMATVFGQEVFVRESVESTDDLGLKNYWTSGDDGDVILYGYCREFGFAYDPPILLIDAPLYVGKTWTHEFSVYMLPDTTFYDVWEVTMEVVEEDVYEVGAGSFPGYGLNSYISMRGNPMEGFSLTGQIADSDQRDPDFWFSDGVGEVQYYVDDFYMLESYFGGTTATESYAWDGVKALFR